MAGTQILVHRGGPRTNIRRCFVDGLNHSLVSSVAQAKDNGERETRETDDEAKGLREEERGKATFLCSQIYIERERERERERDVWQQGMEASNVARVVTRLVVPFKVSRAV